MLLPTDLRSQQYAAADDSEKTWARYDKRYIVHVIGTLAVVKRLKVRSHN